MIPLSPLLAEWGFLDCSSLPSRSFLPLFHPLLALIRRFRFFALQVLIKQLRIYEAKQVLSLRFVMRVRDA